MNRLSKFILFFDRFPGRDLGVITCCFLFVVLSAMSPFDRYALLHDGKAVMGEVVNVEPYITGTDIRYQFRSDNGEQVEGLQKVLNFDEYKIDRNKLPQKIEVIYVPSKPDLSWLGRKRTETADGFWRKYIYETVIATFILYLIVKVIWWLDRYFKQRKERLAINENYLNGTE